MPIISRIGRRSAKVRLLIASIYILLIYLQCLNKHEIYYLPKRSIELQHYNFCLFSKKHFSSLFLLLLLLL